MKTRAQNTRNILFSVLIGFTTLTIALLLPLSVSSQQVIKFKSGKIYEVKLISQNADSIKYEMNSAPGIVFSASMDQVEKIWNQGKSSGLEQRNKDQTDINYLNSRIKRANNLTATGAVMAVIGGGVCALGFSIKTDLDEEDYTSFQEANQKALRAAVIAIGGLVCAGGITLSVIGATNSAKYKEKLKGLSVDVKATSSMAGLSLKYRF